MSKVTVEQARRYLRIVHGLDDDLLQDLIDAAEDEALLFLDRSSLPRRNQTCPDECESESDLSPISDSDDLAPTVRQGILCFVQALYEGTDPDDMQKLRETAHNLLWPYRCNLGA